jgi:hypothetical protein
MFRIRYPAGYPASQIRYPAGYPASQIRNPAGYQYQKGRIIRPEIRSVEYPVYPYL